MTTPSPVHNVPRPEKVIDQIEAPWIDAPLYARMAQFEVGQLHISPEMLICGRTLPTTTMVLTSQGKTSVKAMTNLAVEIYIGDENTLTILEDKFDLDRKPLIIDVTLSETNFMRIAARLREKRKVFADDHDWTSPPAFRFDITELELVDDALVGLIDSVSSINVPPATLTVPP